MTIPQLLAKRREIVAALRKLEVEELTEGDAEAAAHPQMYASFGTGPAAGKNTFTLSATRSLSPVAAGMAATWLYGAPDAGGLPANAAEITDVQAAAVSALVVGDISTADGPTTNAEGEALSSVEPARAKDHRDCMLEEMKWLAEDMQASVHVIILVLHI
jgi:hypothetical protein